MNHSLRLCFRILILISGPALTGWIVGQEMTFLYWFLPAVGILWLASLYLVFGPAPWRRRLRSLALIVASVVVFGFLASKLVRYEGSASGSSFPRFSWVWTSVDSMPTPLAVVAATVIDPGMVSAQLENFLGPGRNGIRETLPFGTDWGVNPPQLLWRRPIGKAWSSFVVSGNRAITQQQVGDDEHVTCIELSTGRDLWDHVDAQVRLLLERAENGGAAMGGDGPRATPTIFEGKVYVMGGTGIINCLELETGKLVWSRNLIKELEGEVQRWGMASSPLILPGGKGVVFAGPEKPGPTLVACDLFTGKDVWIYEGGGASYSSPRLMTFSGVEQVVSVNATDVSGVEPATGRELWRHPWPGNFPKVAQPLAYGDERLLVTASYRVGSLLLRISLVGGSFAVEQVWKSTRLKTKFSSAAVLGDYAYGLDEGRLACIDLANGERVWKNEKFGFGQHLLFEDRLLVQTESGDVVVGQVSPEKFVEQGRIPALSSMTWNTPAVAGRVLLVRNDREAACYLLPPYGD
ncbi:MAG TPA: PQQ-like beta-propeller repeat protein [Verrucomicrobiales bacterium]|nr:PQQ-like beta-propeller repeat protein [Verrucomicrobiales bacterium]